MMSIVKQITPFSIPHASTPPSAPQPQPRPTPSFAPPPAPIVDFNFQDDDSLRSSRTPSFTPTPGYLQTQKKTI